MSTVAPARPWVGKSQGRSHVVDRIRFPAGASPAARGVRELIAQVAPFFTTVLVLGESGTGKELVAHQLHANSDRAQGPFIPVNCGAIPADLLESELFGHERGAFTGAVSARQGRFELANGGTIFLDEIGEMSPHMQVKLLRVIQQRTFERVGSCETRTTDVRIIAATHRDLEEEVRAGRFRQDLFFRLNVFPIQIPALRERIADLPVLIEEFHIQLELRGHHPVRFAPCALGALERYEWPGNVRELENLLERLSVMHAGALVRGVDLPSRYCSANPDDSGNFPEIGATVSNSEAVLPPQGVSLKTLLAGIERQYIEQALARTHGVVSQAARLLGLGRTTLLEKMRKLHMN
jgi:sigma-54 specific flagellar transcriptional regulator A